MMTKPLPSAEALRTAFRYDPETGLLYWRARADVPAKWNGRYAGTVAGNTARGRWTVILAGQHFKAHRVIWKMVFGTEPVEVDHIDGDGLNNRLANLREATRTQNMWNTRGRAVTGFKGVSLHRQSGLYRARLRVDGKEKSLGLYPTAEEAHVVYCAAAVEHRGEFARVT
jgi:hypothetical protein